MIMRSRSGIVLVVVLAIASIGLLIGAGSLLLFRNQCQLRIERQHELEKLYAVRSVMNYIRPYGGDPAGKTFQFRGNSDYDLNLMVDPVKPVFPAAFPTNGVKDFVMETGNLSIPDQSATGCYDYDFDCECGVVGNTNLFAVTNVVIEQSKQGVVTNYGLIFSGLTNSLSCWVNVGMSHTNGWAQEEYGLRYWFRLKKSASNYDCIRFCLVRDVKNIAEANGRSHGWPLSMCGKVGDDDKLEVSETALVFEIRPGTADTEVRLSEWQYSGNKERPAVNQLLRSEDFSNPKKIPSLGYMGVQLVRDKVSLFYVDRADTEGGADYDPILQGYVFSAVTNLSPSVYNYFTNTLVLGEYGRERYYDGLIVNSDGKIREAPALRAVFEVVGKTDLLSECNAFITNFRVTPAYQYKISLEQSVSLGDHVMVTNLATVIQKTGEYLGKNNISYNEKSYDSHGTRHKGFHADEREYLRKRENSRKK